MNTQINVRMPEILFEQSQVRAEEQGFGTVQDFIRESIREKLFEEPKHTLLRTTIDSLFKQTFTKERLEQLDQELKNILFYKNTDEAYAFFLTYYSSFCWMKKQPLPQLERSRKQLYRCFNTLWEFMGTEQLSFVHKQFFAKEEHYEQKKEELKLKAQQELSTLPLPSFPKGHETLRRFKGIAAKKS